MPELPEVETTMRGISTHIKQQTISNVIVRNYNLRWPIDANIQKILRGKTIQEIERRGKYLLLHTHPGTIIIHLGMSGVLRMLTETIPPKKHDHVDIIFQNKKFLRLTDPRRFGAFIWTKDDSKNHPLLKNLGVEPLTQSFSGKYLWLKAQNRSMPIKSFIMDSKIVTGVGNIYATEALFAAKIHPTTPAKLLSAECLDVLAKAIKKILRDAIKQGGTTVKDFLNSHGKPGYFSQQLKVYGRANLSCYECGNTLVALQVAQRSTVYCENCQQ